MSNNNNNNNDKQRKVALLTGVTGFIGASVLKGLLCDPAQWLVIVIIRPKVVTRTASGKKIRRKKNARPMSSDERMKNLIARLGIPEEHGSRVHLVESHIDATTDSETLYQVIVTEISRHMPGQPLRLDLVIHMAASLQQDCPGMPDEKAERIRQRNQDVNVTGCTSILDCIGRFGCPETVRVVRTSIVCGADSSTGAMAFLNYFKSRWIRFMGRVLFYFQKSIPFFGCEDAILDIIDIKDVVGAVMDLVHLDCDAPRETGLGAVYYMSTAYVHGKRKGLLKEEPVYMKPDQEYHNSYEETKAHAEHVVHTWAARLSGEKDMCTYHNLTNENSPTLKQVIVMMYEYYKGPLSYAEKFQFYDDVDAFHAALLEIRPRIAGRYLKKYYRYIHVLSAYLVRDPGTTFDSSLTTKILGHPAAMTPISAMTFSSRA